MIIGHVATRRSCRVAQWLVRPAGIASGMNDATVCSLWRVSLFSIALCLFLFIMIIKVALNLFVKNKKEG